MGFLNKFFGKGQPTAPQPSDPPKSEDPRLHDPDSVTRTEFVSTLDDQQLLAQIIKQDRNVHVREAAYRRLRDPEVWMELASDNDRRVAFEALAEIPDCAIIESLIPTLLPGLLLGIVSTDSIISMQARRAIRRVGDPAVDGLLKIALSDHQSSMNRDRARNALIGIGTPTATEALAVFDEADSAARESEEFQTLRAYWRARATEYWHNRMGSAVCDACNSPLPRGEGYLCGSRLNCETCCTKMLDANALKAVRRNLDYFGAGELSAARSWLGT